MKLIHTGDIHIGSAMKNLPTAKSQIRKREIIDGFRSLAAFAREQNVDAVLIAGDLFDENAVERQVAQEVFSIISSAEPVCFFYVSGNHDDEFSQNEGLPKNLYLFSQTHAWQGYRLKENVVITGADTRNFSTHLFENLRLNPADFNVVLLHGDIEKKNAKESIPLALMQGKGVDYFALGHIHKPMAQASRLDGRARFRYCGALEGRGFDETGEKGFYQGVIADDGAVSIEFVPFAQRKYEILTVDVTGKAPRAAVEEALPPDTEQDLYRILLTGEAERVEVSALEEALKGRFYALEVRDQTRLPRALWARAGEDSLAGLFLQKLK